MADGPASLKELKHDPRICICRALVIVTVVICGLVYPVGILVFAMLAVPQQRLGSLIEGRRGVPVGSRLVAQPFRARSISGRVLQLPATMRLRREAVTCRRATRCCASVPRKSQAGSLCQRSRQFPPTWLRPPVRGSTRTSVWRGHWRKSRVWPTAAESAKIP